MTNASIPVNSLILFAEDEPRIPDVEVGRQLGMSRPTNIRQVILRNIEELQTFGSLHSERAVIEAGKGAQRETTAYYLLEGQALLVAMLSRAPRAPQVRKALIEVFMAWRQGRLYEPPARVLPVTVPKNPRINASAPTQAEVAEAAGGRSQVRLSELLDAFGVPAGKQGQPAAMTIGRCMVRLGYSVGRARDPMTGERERTYYLCPSEAPAVPVPRGVARVNYEMFLLDMREIGETLLRVIDRALDNHETL